MNYHLRATVSGLANQLTVTIVSFILVPVILAGLGPELFGVWAMLNVVRSLEAISDFGITGAIVMFVSGARSSEDKNELITIGLLSNVATTFATVLVLFALRDQILQQIFNVSGQALVVTEQAYVITLASSLVLVVARTMGSVIGAFQRFDIQMAIDTVMAVLGGLLTWWALRIGLGLISVVTVTLIVSGLQAFAMTLAMIRVYPSYRFRPKIAKPMLIKASKYTIKGRGGDIGLLMSEPILKSLASTGLGVESVGLLQIGSSLASIPNSAVHSMVGNLFPALAQHYGTGEFSGIRKLSTRYLLYIAYFMLPPTVLLLVASPVLLHWWLGVSDPAVIATTRLFAVVFAVRAIVGIVPWRVANGLEHPEHCTIAMAIHISLLLVGGATLLKFGHFSYVGILLIYLVSYLAGSIYLWWQMEKNVPILFSSDGNKWLFLFLRVAAISVGIGLLNWLTLNYLTYDLLALAVSVALMLLSYVMIGLTLPRSDRVELQMLLSTAIAGLRNLRA